MRRRDGHARTPDRCAGNNTAADSPTGFFADDRASLRADDCAYEHNVDRGIGAHLRPPGNDKANARSNQGANDRADQGADFSRPGR
jgi:hypothetical protein